MKNKTVFLIFFILFSLTVSGCTATNKAYMDRYYSINSSISISLSERQSMINNHESFVVLDYKSGCSTCEQIKLAFDNLAADENIKLYVMDLSGEDTNLDWPAVEIYIDGSREKLEKRTSVLESREKIYTLIKDYFYITLKYYIDYEQIDEIINQDKAVVLFEMSGCTDCKAMDELFLNKWMIKNQNKGYKIYTFDTANFSEDGMTYSQFKDKYGLSVSGNDTFGYLQGFVPTFQYYENGVLEDAVVFYNDQFTIGSEDSIVYTMASSYYSDSPYIGHSYSSIDEYHKKTVSFFAEKVKNLLLRVSS